jgi:hypothetical protein
MRRRLFGVVSAISLLLCSAIVVLWVQSYSDGYYADWRQQDGGVDFNACTGRMSVSRYRVLRHEYSFVGFRHGRLSPNIEWNKVIPGSRLYFGSFAAGWNNTGAIAAFNLILPYWLFVVLTAIAPGCWLAARLSRRRHKRGFEPLPQSPVPKAPAEKSPRQA